MDVTLLNAIAALSAPESEIGGKAAGLARLWAEGCPVPAFLVVPAPAFRGHLRRAGVAEVLGASRFEWDEHTGDEDVEEAARWLTGAVLSQPLARGVADAVTDALDHLGPGPWAVRSSMAGEDSAEHSFAGQLDSFVFLTDGVAVCDAIRRCWASAFGSRVLHYGRRVGLDLPAVRMGVVVQQMVDAEVSAVAFTANPLTGDRHEVLVTAAWGLGEGIVSGLCDTDEYVWVAGEGERRCTVADKAVRITVAADGSGTIKESVPDAQRSARALTPEQVEEIGRLGTDLQASWGRPQDLELAYADGHLHVLQARPVTSLPEPVNTDGPVVLWDNSNIQESYCGVTTPLTFSFASEAYAAVYETFFRMAGAPEELLREKHDRLRNLLGLIDGRVYYNLDNWYEGVLLLPSASHNKADMEQMMGVDEPVEFVEDHELSVPARLRRAAALAPVYGKLLPQLALADRRIAVFQEHVRGVLDGVDRRALPEMTFSQLMGVIAFLDRELMHHWDVPILNDVRVMQANGALRRAVAGILAVDEADGEVGRVVNDLLAGIDGLESAEPTRMLLRMAAVAREDPGLAAALRRGDAGDALAAVRREHPTFAARVDEYVERYGDRVMGELKLESHSLREDPRFIIYVLRNYLDRPDLTAESLSQRESEVHRRAMEDLVGRLGSRPARATLAHKVAASRRAVQARESLRLDRTRLFGLYRDLYRAIGARLAEIGRLDDPEDVFWLTRDEILAHHEGRSVTHDLAALTRLRRADFAHFGERELPHRFESVGPVGHGNRFEAPPPADTGPTLHGTGCYPGVVEGEVRLIHSPHDGLTVNGRILAAVRTDPGWAPLFPSCAGLLVERGSTLSHSAVVARELGIPAIVGIRDLTRVVADGEHVRMDGATGEVRRLAGSAPATGEVWRP